MRHNDTQTEDGARTGQDGHTGLVTAIGRVTDDALRSALLVAAYVANNPPAHDRNETTWGVTENDSTGITIGLFRY